MTIRELSNNPLYIPLLFWFKDIKGVLPRLPWGQLQIKVDLADYQDIIGYSDGGGGGAYQPPTIEFCNLYVNQLFTSPEIFQLYAKKYVFSIIRTHRSHKQVVSVKGDYTYKILLNNLKWPTEVIYFSFRPRENLLLSQHWHKNSRLIEKFYKIPVIAKNQSSVILVSPLSQSSTTDNSIIANSNSPLSGENDKYVNYDLVITSGAGFNNVDITMNNYTVKSYNGDTKEIVIDKKWNGVKPDETTIFELYTPQLAIGKVSYYKEVPVVDKISLECNGIKIYKTNTSSFYNSYLPMNFKDVNIPTDCGMYMMPFCTKLLQHNPSGSINLSLCRELYIKFTSSVISKEYPVDLICLSKAINFLIVDTDIGMTMRYCN